MRISGGNLKGRTIIAPENFPVRPTTDFAKIALFNILNNQIDWEETLAFDLFSGTGTISYELASRECKNVISVEWNDKAQQFIKSTIQRLNIPQIVSLKMDVFNFLKLNTYQSNLVFADPPFDSDFFNELPIAIMESQMLMKEALVVVEHPSEINYSQLPEFIEKRTYGKVNFSFFKK